MVLLFYVLCVCFHIMRVKGDKVRARSIRFSRCSCIHSCRVCLCVRTCEFDDVRLCVFCMEINNNIITQGSLLRVDLSSVAVCV